MLVLPMRSPSRAHLYISLYGLHGNVQTARYSREPVYTAMKVTSKEGRRMGITTVEGLLIALLLVFGTLTLAYVTATMADSQQIASLQSQVVGLQAGANTRTGMGAPAVATLPLMNQTTTVRQIWETWYKSASAAQDRFEPAFPVVNQGDTIQITL